MGNCAGNPKTKEGEEAPIPVPEEVKVEQQETKPEDTPVQVSSDDNSLSTLLNENGEKKEEAVEAKEEEVKTEEVKAEAEVEEKKEEEEPKPETKEETPALVQA